VQEGVYYDAGGQPGNAVAWESDRTNADSLDFFRGTRATLEGAYASTSNGDAVHTASLTTDDSVADVLAFYKDELSDWTVDQESTSEVNGSESGILTVSNGDRTAAITASETDGTTTVSINHTGPAA